MPPVSDGTYPSICRLCLAFCPIEVTVEGGRAVRVAGDRSGTPYDGYTCPKGRALPDQHYSAQRLLRPLKRENGALREIASAHAVAEIATRVRKIVDLHGPDAIAFYIGTGVVSNPTGQGPGVAFMKALGSAMIFSAATIDKPGANVSMALHGTWMAGANRMEDSESWLIVGANPVIAKSNGAPPNNPGQRLKEAVARGMSLIVVDPRRTETARRATVHLQIKPGEDPALLACLIHVILSENLQDQAFLDRHAEGLESLRKAVAPFTPDHVADRAGVPRDDLIRAARLFANGRTGGAICGTGPSFATDSNLSFYLALCLNTICGHWPRAGQPVPFPNLLLPAYVPKAQAFAPYPAFGDRVLSASGMRQNASGMPTAGLADQILTDGPGKIRALFCVGGNPVLAFPDQARTEAAMADLDLLVAFDYRVTATAELADYIIPPPLTLEIAGNTQMVEWLKYIGVTRGMSVPWAQHTPAVVDPPPGSDLMDDGEFFFRLAQALDLQLTLNFVSGLGPHLEVPTRSVPLDMAGDPPTVEDLLDIAAVGSRIPLDEVKSYSHGRLYDTSSVIVQEADPGHTARLQLADPMMLDDLRRLETAPISNRMLSLICRRVNNFVNSIGQDLLALTHGDPRNPFHLHPDDMTRLGLNPADRIVVRSAHGTVAGIVLPDESLRRGTVSLTHGFGGRIEQDDVGNVDRGASVARLVGLDEVDPVTGIPRMTALAVEITRS